MSKESYKKSKFNFFVESNDAESYIVTNFLTKHTIKISAWHKFVYDNTDEFHLDDVNNLVLAEKGFIVKNDFDELSYLCNEIEKEVNSDEVFFILCLSSYCNLSCIYSFEGKDKENKNMTKSTQDDVATFIEDIIKKSEFKTLRIWWYGGEPLLNLEALSNISKKLISIASEYKLNYIARIVTNGVLFDQKTVDVLEVAKVSEAQITIDGASAKAHDMTRPFKDGRGSFDTIINNLYTIKTNIKIIVVFIINKNNKNEIKNMHELVRDMKTKTGNSVFLQVSSLLENSKNAKDVKDIVLEYEELKDVTKDIENDELTEKPENFRVCSAQHKHSYVIDVNGYLYKCPTILNNKDYVICNIADADCHKKINTSKALLSFIESRWLYPSEKCLNCVFFAYCAGKCPLKYKDGTCNYDALKKYYEITLLKYYGDNKGNTD